MRLTAACALSGALVLASVDCGGSNHDGGGHGSRSALDDGGDPFSNSHPIPVGDGGSSDASASADAAGADAAEPTCGKSPFAAAPVQVNVLLVIDKSGSMSDMPDKFDTDKWSAMKSSVAAALDPLKDQIHLGLELYPVAGCDLMEGSGVDVDVQPGATALPLLTKALADADPGGGTPTAAALARALAYYKTGAGSKLKGNKYVLLATDGGPNCNDALSCGADTCTVNLDGQCPSSVDNCCDEAMAGPGAQQGCLDDAATLDQIKALAAAGIDTFVIGIPGSEDYASALDRFADAGGAPNQSGPPSYFAVTASGSETSGLTTVLSTVASGLIMSCRLQLESMPPDVEKLNVEVDGTLVPQSGSDGWALDSSTTPPTIELKGDTCKHVEQDGAKSVTVVFGCPTLLQ